MSESSDYHRSRSPGFARSRSPAGFARSRSPPVFARSRSPPRRPQNRGPNPTVFVRGLAPETDDRSLREFFSSVGPVVDTKVVYDMETGRSKCFGFVKFEDPRDAAYAVETVDGKVLGGRSIRCNIAKYPPGGARGRGTVQYGRPRRPARSRSRSPRPRSPYAYSGSSYGSEGYSRDSRDSRSPPAKRRRPLSPGQHPPMRPRRLPPPRRPPPADAPSSGTSMPSSGSAGVRDRSPPKRPPPASVPGAGVGLGAPPPGEFKQQLLTVRRRESELAARVQVLEGEMEGGRGALTSLKEQLDDFQQDLQVHQQVIGQYRKWLSAVVECGKRLVEAREAVGRAEREAQGREQDLAVLVSEATRFRDREMAVAAEAAKEREQQQKRLAAVEQSVQQQQQHAADLAAEPSYDANGMERSQAGGEEDPGGWGEGLADGAAPAADPAALFKPGIKFKLAA